MNDKLIELAEDFFRWLKEMEEKYQTPSDDIQALIKQLLM